jgi:hypothetical protein
MAIGNGNKKQSRQEAVGRRQAAGKEMKNEK